MSIEKLTSGKTVRIVFLICCILFTAAFIYDAVSSATHRKYVESELYDIVIRISDLDSNVDSVWRNARSIDNKIDKIDESLSLISRRIR